MSILCRLFGFTRQGLWKQSQSHIVEEIDNTALIGDVRLIRQDLPRLGVRKLQLLLAEKGHRVSRDKLFALLRASGMLVKRTHTRIITTYSRHWMKKWPNLIKDRVPTHADEIWVSDITYVEMADRSRKRSFLYLSLITDAYTHEIVGYALHESLDTEGPLRALRMALSKIEARTAKGLVHHSDRGCQYCCRDYVRVLQSYGISISMTDNGDPYENAIAERVNGILKTEWLYGMKLSSVAQAKEAVDKIVRLYNTVRPHESIGNKTPSAARMSEEPLRKLWKNYWREKNRQQQAGEEGPSTEPPADSLIVADAHASRAAAVP